MNPQISISHFCCSYHNFVVLITEHGQAFNHSMPREYEEAMISSTCRSMPKHEQIVHLIGTPFLHQAPHTPEIRLGFSHGLSQMQIHVPLAEKKETRSSVPYIHDPTCQSSIHYKQQGFKFLCSPRSTSLTTHQQNSLELQQHYPSVLTVSDSHQHCENPTTTAYTSKSASHRKNLCPSHRQALVHVVSKPHQSLSLTPPPTLEQ